VKEMGKRIRNIIGGVLALLKGREEVIIEKEEIMEILPHRGRMLLLDRVVINNTKISGEFLVTEEVCEGHRLDDQLVLRGADILDMAAQLLGVWAAKHSQMNNSLAYVREYGRTKFLDKVLPGDQLIMEINTKDKSGNENPQIIISVSGDREVRKIIGKEFTARVGKKNKATIFYVALTPFDLQSLA